METQEAEKRPKRKIMKILLLGTAALIIAVFLGRVIWKMSGSNQWKLAIDKNGTKIYTLKSPGSNMIKVRGVTRWKFSLSQAVSPFFDESIQDDCGKWLPACTEYKILKQNSYPQLQTNLQLYRWKFPFPFAPREILVQGQVHQDKETKEIVLENIAVQNAIPQTVGYVRATHHHNVWRFTPKRDGDVEVEFIMDMNFGGFFPDLVTNLGGASQVFKILVEDYPKLIEKYRNAKFDFIEELATKENRT